jgi:sugar phosphate isomerase/epimerase
MMLRPRKIATLAAWDEHVRHCQSRLAELALAAEPLGITIGVENHLDFTTEELRDLIVAADSPQVGVIFDVGNTIGTLDDPTEAADILGPHVVATHYKDFAVVENANGFQLTMVPLGAGSLRLDEITARLLKHVGPDVNFSIEMMNGQQLQVDWLEDRFWTPFRNKTPQQIAATLRHIRSQEIDRARFIPQTEVDKLSHEKHLQFEADRIKQCIAYLKEQVATNDSRESTR